MTKAEAIAYLRKKVALEKAMENIAPVSTEGTEEEFRKMEKLEEHEDEATHD